MTTRHSDGGTTATTKLGVYGHSSEKVSLSAEKSLKKGTVGGFKKSPSRKCTLNTGEQGYQLVQAKPKIGI